MALSPSGVLIWAHLGSFGSIWALSVVAWAHLGGPGWSWVAHLGACWEPGGRPSQRSRGPEADVAMAREAAMVLRRIVLWPEPEAWRDP